MKRINQTKNQSREELSTGRLIRAVPTGVLSHVIGAQPSLYRKVGTMLRTMAKDRGVEITKFTPKDDVISTYRGYGTDAMDVDMDSVELSETRHDTFSVLTLRAMTSKGARVELKLFSKDGQTFKNIKKVVYKSL